MSYPTDPGNPQGVAPQGAPQPPPQGPPPAGWAAPPPPYGQPQQPPQGAYAPRPPYGYPQPPYAAPGPPPGWGVPRGPMGPPPGYGAPPPQHIKRSPIPLILGLAVLAFMAVGALVAFVSSLGASGSGGSSIFAFGDKIAILDVEGVLGEGPGYGADTDRLIKLVDKWTDDDSIKGMVIRVNSPGGAVGATEELYHAIRKFQAEKKPVVASMGDIAASGGFYIAMPAERIFTNSGTLTGSVGVIMNLWGYEDLTNKIGIDFRTIKSGHFKDIGSGSREMTPEERQLLEDMVADVHKQFIAVVETNRMDAGRAALAAKSEKKPSEVKDEEVREYIASYCDGRIFSGDQALALGFADEIGTEDAAVDYLRRKLGLDEDSPLVRTPNPQRGLFGSVKQKMMALTQGTPGLVTMEYRFGM